MQRSVWISLALLFALGGCVDVRTFGGRWRGRVAEEQAIRQGFTLETEIAPLVIDSVSLDNLNATLTTSDGRFQDVRLVRVAKSSADRISSLTFEGDPLRSYLMFGAPSNESPSAPAYMLLSLFSDDRAEMRIWRGNDLYGLFALDRE